MLTFRQYLVIIALCFYIHYDVKSKDIITFDSVEQNSIYSRKKKREIIFKHVYFNNKNQKGGKKGPLGPKQFNYIEYNYQNKNFTYTFSWLKRPEENMFFYKQNKLFYITNSYNGYLSINCNSILRYILVGDYTLGSGQGLIFNNVWTMYTISDPIKIFKIQRGINGCKNHYQNKIKGIAVEIKLKQNITLIPFCGYNALDANNHKSYVSSVFRRDAYINKKKLMQRNSLLEKIYGCIVSLNDKKDNYEFGFNFVKTKFSVPLKLADTRQLGYIFSGNRNINLGMFARFLFGPIHFFYEQSGCYAPRAKTPKGKAMIIGCIINTFKFLDIALCYRFYSKNYYNFYGKSMCNHNGGNCSNLKGAGRNEKGIYLACILYPSDNMSIACNMDLFYNDKSFNYLERNGRNIALCLKYTFPNTQNNISITCKNTNKKHKVKSRNSFNQDQDYIYTKINSTYKLKDNITLQSQLHFCSIYFSKIDFGIYGALGYKTTKYNIEMFLGIVNNKYNKALNIIAKDLIRQNLLCIKKPCIKIGIKIRNMIALFYTIKYSLLVIYTHNFKEQNKLQRNNMCFKLLIMFKD